MSPLPPSAEELRAQLQATLAIRLVVMPRQYDNEQADLARSALGCLPSVVGRLARADMLLGIRAGLQDDASPGELLRYARQLLDLGWETHSVYHIEEALAACIIDLIRAGNFTELPSALRAHRDFTERSATPTVLYTDTLIGAMLALARGDFGQAESGTGRAGQLSGDWGASYAREALMGQALAGCSTRLDGQQRWPNPHQLARTRCERAEPGGMGVRHRAHSRGKRGTGPGSARPP